ncbi:MAG: M23 family metallopeptidase [Chloroflexi bacterium]|nr:MAG: M23 family metallopeptidase [Chloroflexota bacterium]
MKLYSQTAKPGQGLSPTVKVLIAAFFILFLAAGWVLYRRFGIPTRRSASVVAWIRNPELHPDWAVEAGDVCGNAPFQMPTRGFIGFVWQDSFRIGHQHQGLDIFGGTDINVTPVYAAYPGYLTRQQDWKSSLIIRIPNDPLQPGRQFWNYYTHLADSMGNSFISPDFPPGTSGVFVEAGTLLGYQGNFSGDPGNPTGVHLHFSIVKDDGSGKWLNELEIDNTIDPSQYFGLPLNASENPDEFLVCNK